MMKQDALAEALKRKAQGLDLTIIVGDSKKADEKSSDLAPEGEEKPEMEAMGEMESEGPSSEDHAAKMAELEALLGHKPLGGLKKEAEAMPVGMESDAPGKPKGLGAKVAALMASKGKK